MSMKLTDLMKLKGRKIEGRMGGATPDRFGKGATEIVDKKEQRRRDQEAGLVPFAVKLHGDLIKRLHALALERHLSLNELTAELINAGLGEAPASPSTPAAKAEAKPEPKPEAKSAPAAETPAAKKSQPAKPPAKAAAEPAAKSKAKTPAEPAPKPATKKPAAKTEATPAAKPATKKK